MPPSERMLVIGAHSADFVWRAGGAIAVCTRPGAQAHVVALSYGERGESGELWKEPGQTVERVKQERRARPSARRPLSGRPSSASTSATTR